MQTMGVLFCRDPPFHVLSPPLDRELFYFQVLVCFFFFVLTCLVSRIQPMLSNYRLNYCSEVVSLKEEQEAGILERQTKKIKKKSTKPCHVSFSCLSKFSGWK